MGDENLGFFIDTGPAEVEPTDAPIITEDTKDSGKVLGLKESAKAEQLRKRAENERNLAKLLFGRAPVSADEGVGLEEGEGDKKGSGDEEDESSGDDESSEDHSDLSEDELAVASSGEEEEEDGETGLPEVESDDAEEGEEREDGEDEEEEEEDDSKTDLIPEDVLAKNLNIRRGKKRKAAWKDEADDEVLVKDVTANYRKAKGKHGQKEISTEKYEKALQRNFKSLVGEPSWARLDRDGGKAGQQGEGEDSDEEFFRETTDLLDHRKKRKGREGGMQQGTLEFRKLKDVNYESHGEGAVIRCSEFHPTSTVGLVAGLNGTASLFQIDGRNNPKIQTVNFKDFPVKTARFSHSGEEFIVGSQHHSHFYSYDMMAGKIVKIPWNNRLGPFNSQKFDVSPDGRFLAFKGRMGSIHLFTARAKEYVRSLKMNEECQALTFSKSGDILYTHGEGGEVYSWDMRSSLCSGKFIDDGCISGSALAVNRSYLATGSSEGVVNIYSLSSLTRSNPKPDKVILNLSTQINQLSFSPGGEVLAISSEIKDSAVKLLHFPSLTVFSNFPNPSFNMNKVNSVGWSPGGGYLSLGNNRGAALLYRIKHFAEY